jgi:hypothetical protein
MIDNRNLIHLIYVTIYPLDQLFFGCNTNTFETDSDQFTKEALDEVQP